ncbi:MAG: hypothetical protein EBT75_04325, partial [Proteobacteria bacterium]|nr:hypothetical protein [Pseudomonadota bacterium]
MRPHGFFHRSSCRAFRRLWLGRRLWTRIGANIRHHEPWRTSRHFESPALNTTQIRDILATRGLRPLRQLGQNFLAEPALATVIAHSLPKSTAEPVQEIGPGLGALTRALLTIGHSVEAFEIDHGLTAWLREEFQNERRMPDAEVEALVAWVRAGGAATVAAPARARSLPAEPAA